MNDDIFNISDLEFNNIVSDMISGYNPPPPPPPPPTPKQPRVSKKDVEWLNEIVPFYYVPDDEKPVYHIVTKVTKKYLKTKHLDIEYKIGWKDGVFQNINDMSHEIKLKMAEEYHRTYEDLKIKLKRLEEFKNGNPDYLI